MRILHFYEPPSHGVPNYVNFLSANQRRQGHDSRVIGPSQPNSDPRWATDLSISRRSPKSLLRAGHAVNDLASRFEADVVHVHSFFSGVSMRLAPASTPVVYTPHAWGFERRAVSAPLERAMVNGFAQVACVSDAASASGAERLKLQVPVDTIGSAIDLDRFSPTGPIPEAAKALQPYVVCVGRISKQKGQLDLAREWQSQMATSSHNLVIVGDGHPELTAYPHREGNVHFVGASTDVQGWIRGSEFAVQPSRWEAMSLVTIEALACGRSVLATDVAGMTEAISDLPHEPAGTVVENIAELVSAAAARFDDQLLVQRERNAARGRAEGLYSPDALVERSVQIYARAAGTPIDITTSATTTQATEAAA